MQAAHLQQRQESVGLPSFPQRTPSNSETLIPFYTYTYNQPMNYFLYSGRPNSICIRIRSSKHYSLTSKWDWEMDTLDRLGRKVRLMVQPSTARFSLVQPGLDRYSLTQPGTAWYSLVQPGTTWNSLVQSATTWYSLVQSGTVWYNQTLSPLSLHLFSWHHQQPPHKKRGQGEIQFQTHWVNFFAENY